MDREIIKEVLGFAKDSIADNENPELLVTMKSGKEHRVNEYSIRCWIEASDDSYFDIHYNNSITFIPIDEIETIEVIWH